MTARCSGNPSVPLAAGLRDGRNLKFDQTDPAKDSVNLQEMWVFVEKTYFAECVAFDSKEKKFLSSAFVPESPGLTSSLPSARPPCRPSGLSILIASLFLLI